MNGRIIFLLEEPSMREFLDGLLPRLFPHLVFQCVPHEGKSDLQKSIPRKLTGWREPGVKFVIVRDNDGADCVAVKAQLKEICERAHRPDTLIRLVCQELEGWYIGDLKALATAYPGAHVDTQPNRKRYKSPDEWPRPSSEVERLVSQFQKIDGARRMSNLLSPDTNASNSFHVFFNGVHDLALTMDYRKAG